MSNTNKENYTILKLKGGNVLHIGFYSHQNASAMKKLPKEYKDYDLSNHITDNREFCQSNGNKLETPRVFVYPFFRIATKKLRV